MLVRVNLHAHSGIVLYSDEWVCATAAVIKGSWTPRRLWVQSPLRVTSALGKVACLAYD